MSETTIERSPEKRIGVTGVGCVSPLGHEVKEAEDNIFDGRDGIGLMPREIRECYPQLEAKTAALVRDFDPSRDQLVDLSDKASQRLHTSSLFALWASTKALRQAGLVGDAMPERGSEVSLIEHRQLQLNIQERVSPERIAISIGTGMGGGDEAGDAQKRLGIISDDGGRNKLSPYAVLRILPERVATVASIHFGIKGPVMEVTGACATGNMNIIQGARLLRLGEADVAVVGGTESQISPVGIALFNGIKALDTSDDPKIASRPFHKDKRGFVMGEGAGVLVLETLEHAKRRGALVLAELAGYSSTADAYHETSPSGEGMVRALKLAIGRIRLSDASVYVNAHATGTKGDESELKSIAEVLDRAQVAGISSTKGATGHMMGAAGAFEALVSIASLRRRQIPPSLKLDRPIDVAKDWPMSPFETTPAPDLNLAVNLSLGFGGLNAVTVWRRGEAA